MRYRAELTIPAGTPASAPVELAVPLCYGTISEIEVTFPAGHAGLTYVSIWRFERQLLPTSPGVAFRGDDVLITLQDQIPIYESPLEVSLRGWAPLATLDHIVIVSLSVMAELPPREAFGWFVPLPEGIA